ncbi:MAG: hypothetical protein OXF93_18480 [Acidobacteria bacterium]|nr:hypothetical protein [Acidobacteriota bacterium]
MSDDSGAVEAGRFYRLCALSGSGLLAYDRLAFAALDRAEEWRERREREDYVSLGITCHAVLPDDVVMVDGQWIGPERPATRYGRPAGSFGYLGGGYEPAASEAPPIASDALVVHTQPQHWIGELFLGALGSGVVWSGWEMLPVRDHRICDSAPPGYRGLYAWNLGATQELWPDAKVADGLVLLPLTARQRKRWLLPPLARYVLLRHPGEAAPGGPGPVRTPWPGVAVSEHQLRRLFELDCLRPETEALEIYRAVRLTPKGLAPFGPDGYGTLARARMALGARARPGAEARAVTVCDGLPADVTRIDGRPFESGRQRAAAGECGRVAWVEPAGAGQPVVDERGDGFLLGRSRLVRITGGRIAEPGAGLAGGPAWMYRALAKVRVDPLTPHVHGVVVKVNRTEVGSWGLPAGTKAVLLARGVRSGTVAWRCLDGDAFKALRAGDAPDVPMEGSIKELPAGVDAGGGDEEPAVARETDGE